MRKEHHMSRLIASSFKHSVDTYWLTSLESPNQLWTEELAASSAEVIKFNARSRDGCPVASFFTFGDTFEHFRGQWESKVSHCLARSV